MADVLVDTGFVYAIADPRDAWHERANAWQITRRDDLVIPVTVLPEACYLLSENIGAHAEHRFLESISIRELRVTDLADDDLERILDLLDEYEDTNIGFVDASVVAIAERLGIRKILTTDRRHFAAIRPRHCKAFELLP